MNTVETLRLVANAARNNHHPSVCAACDAAATTLDRLLMAAANVIMVHDDGRLAGKGDSRAIETLRELIKEEQA